MKKTINDTDFINLPLLIKGKVRNVYDLGEKLLVVATDRISAFDVVFDDMIPDKGKVLNSLSAFWFEFMKDIVKNHVITTDINLYPKELQKYGSELLLRSMLVKKIRMFEVECVVRGYLEGSGLKEYKNKGSICGMKLPEGLRQCEKLPEPIFTPTTKAWQGHDESITFDKLSVMEGNETAGKLRDKSIEIYEKARGYAESKGIILADTKLEFGVHDGEIVLADELITPDSSRLWDAADYEPGRAQKSFDKQYVREYLETIDWDKRPPAPKLPEEVIKKTREKYFEAYEKITGKKLTV